MPLRIADDSKPTVLILAVEVTPCTVSNPVDAVIDPEKVASVPLIIEEDSIPTVLMLAVEVMP